MLDIGWSELILIGVVALIVIGPKDLPDMFRQLGRFTAKLRSMARDFSRAMEQAANESGVKDVAKDLKSVTSPQSLGLNAMKDAAAKFEKWDPLKNAATPTKAPAAVATAAAAQVGPETQALLDKQAARQAIVAESTERLRALNGAARAAPAVATVAPAVTAASNEAASNPAASNPAASSPVASNPVPEPAAKPKSRAKTAKVDDPAPSPPAKPKRKTRKADEA